MMRIAIGIHTRAGSGVPLVGANAAKVTVVEVTLISIHVVNYLLDLSESSG